MAIAQLRDSDDRWCRNPFTIHIPDQTYATVSDTLAASTADDIVSAKKHNKTYGDAVQAATRMLMKSVDASAISDTSIGGNDAINCLWQFNIDDDIIHPIYATDKGTGGEPLSGMGRVYVETYHKAQKVLYLRMGVPHFAGLKDFYSDGSGFTRSKLMNTGDDSLLYSMTSFLAKGLKLTVTLPLLPLTAAYKMMASIEDMPITKYYQFRPTMHLYFRMVNSILAPLAVNMGLYRAFDGLPILENSASAEISKNVLDQFGEAGRPAVLRYGVDIFSIISKRARMKSGEGKIKTTDELIAAVRSEYAASLPINSKGFWNAAGNFITKTWHAGQDAAYGAGDYVGFRIERGTDATESISNQTGESSVAQGLNAKSAAARDKTFSVARGKTGTFIDPAIEAAINMGRAVTDAFSGGQIVDILTGSSIIEIPEVWKSSSFSRSYSFDIQLRAKYGDPITIYQSMYIPLAMLMAAALPRGVSSNAYTSPFLVEAYAQGMYSVPVGMIESMTIKRGLAEHGWTYDGLPTAIDVSLTIKDLSPGFFLSMMTSDGPLENIANVVINTFNVATGGIFSSDNLRNTSMTSYINTLAGLSLADATFGHRARMRKLETSMLILKNTTMNPAFIGNQIGNSPVGRLLSNAIPGGWKVGPNGR